jgi:anti-sigma-K factor RskA
MTRNGQRSQIAARADHSTIWGRKPTWRSRAAANLAAARLRVANEFIDDPQRENALTPLLSVVGSLGGLKMVGRFYRAAGNAGAVTN